MNNKKYDIYPTQHAYLKNNVSEYPKNNFERYDIFEISCESFRYACCAGYIRFVIS